MDNTWVAQFYEESEGDCGVSQGNSIYFFVVDFPEH